MNERTAKRLAVCSPGMYLISMVLPASKDFSSGITWGFQMAILSFYGALYGSIPAITGLLANVLFISACVLLLIRVLRGRPRPGYRAVFRTVVLVPPIMLLSWALLLHPETSLWGMLGFAVWLGSSIMLTIASWRLRHDARFPEQRGFEVIVTREASAN